MPYQIEQRNEQYCVIETNTGEDVGCHPTETAAQEHLTALYANVPDAKSYKAFGDNLKALEGGRVGGYLVRFTDDSAPDLTGEYFTKSTEFYPELYPIKGKPILIEHGLDDTAGILPIGIIDMVKEDDAGIWVEGRLKDKQDYLAMLREMRGKRNLALSDDELLIRAALCENTVKQFFATCKPQWSSGALPQSVEVEPRGNAKWIKKWAIWEASATVQPAEPNGTQITSTLKTLRDTLALKEAATSKEVMQYETKTLPTTNKDTKLMAEEMKPPSEVATETVPTAPQKMGDLLKACYTKAEELLGALLEAMDGEAAGLGEMEKAAATEAMAEELKSVTYGQFETKSFYKAIDDNLSKVFKAGRSAIGKAQEEKRAKQTAAAKSALSEMKPATPEPVKGMGYSANTQQISVSEPRAYASATAEEMALAIRMAAIMGSPNGQIPRKAEATDYVSEGFWKSAVHKMYRSAEQNPLSRPHEQVALKSAMPYKANELDASSLAGQGLEWVSYFYDSQVWERARNLYIYKEMMNRGMIEKEIPAGFKSTTVPVEVNDPTVYGGSEATSLDATGLPETVYQITPFTTANVEVVPGIFRAATAFTHILEEDSLVDIAAQANRQIMLAMEENLEYVMLNGDTATAANTNINSIDGTPTASGLTKSAYLEFNGLLKSPLVTNTTYSRDASNTLAVEDYLNTQSLLPSAQAARLANQLFVVDFWTYQATRKLPEFKTMDVAGQNATVFMGELKTIWGNVAFLMSGFMGKANTAGKVATTTPGNNTRGRILLVYAPYWAFAYKRQLTIEMQRLPNSETTAFYASMRFALKQRSVSASAVTYNVAI